MTIARDVWGKHPDELAGMPWQPYMLEDMMALALLEQESLQREMKSNGNSS